MLRVLAEVFHVKRYQRTAIFMVGALLACAQPTDVVVEIPESSPLSGDGALRLTANPAPDLVRGFLPDGRLLYRTSDLIPFGTGTILASLAVSGGSAREEVGVYRRALRSQMETLAQVPGRRVLGTVNPPLDGLAGCPAPAPLPPSALAVTWFELGEADGVPVSGLPSHTASTGAVTVTVPGSLSYRVRFNPALRDVTVLGANPFGPVLPPDGTTIYSDGETIWRTTLTDTTGARDSVAWGAYPVLSADAGSLIFARPRIVDSVVQTYVIVLGLFMCTQEHVILSSGGWDVVRLDLETAATQVLGSGAEPRPDPLAPRLLVRDGSLFWLSLDGVRSDPIPGTSNAFASAISPDGLFMAFSRRIDDNTDAYFRAIAR
jgi:hypothetical protein